MRQISSFATGEWLGPGAGAKPISSAITGNVIAEVGNDALNVQSMQDYARDVGGSQFAHFDISRQSANVESNCFASQEIPQNTI